MDGPVKKFPTPALVATVTAPGGTAPLPLYCPYCGNGLNGDYDPSGADNYRCNRCTSRFTLTNGRFRLREPNCVIPPDHPTRR